MKKEDIINYFIQKYKFKKYLEIGTQHGKSFNEVICQIKISVDPDVNTKATYKVTSNEFFARNGMLFDIVLVDGDHRSPQILDDIIHSLNCLEKDGIIIVHDCNPISEGMQAVPRVEKQWTGNGWIDILKLRQNPDLEIRVVDTDYGVGIIRRGKQTPLKEITEDYSVFEKNKKELLNLITIEEFERLYL